MVQGSQRISLHENVSGKAYFRELVMISLITSPQGVVVSSCDLCGDVVNSGVN